MKKISIMAIFAMAISVSAFAQYEKTETVDASAYLLKAIKLEKNEGLNFGRIAFSGAGDVILSADETADRTPSTNVFLPVDKGTVTAAKLTVTGEEEASFSLDIPDFVTLTHLSASIGIITMTCNLTPSIESGLSELTLDNTGSLVFYIGGKLNISTDQNPGSYAGEFDVTVAYN